LRPPRRRRKRSCPLLRQPRRAGGVHAAGRGVSRRRAPRARRGGRGGGAAAGHRGPRPPLRRAQRRPPAPPRHVQRAPRPGPAAVARCAVAGPSTAETRARFDALMDRLRTSPAILMGPAGTLAVTYSLVVAVVFELLNAAPTWPLLAQALQHLDEGDTVGF